MCCYFRWIWFIIEWNALTFYIQIAYGGRQSVWHRHNAYLLFINCHHRNHIIFIHEIYRIAACSFRIHIQFCICTFFSVHSLHSYSVRAVFLSLSLSSQHCHSGWLCGDDQAHKNRAVSHIHENWTMEGVGGLTNISYFHAAHQKNKSKRTNKRTTRETFFFLSRPHIKFIINSIHIFYVNAHAFCILYK